MNTKVASCQSEKVVSCQLSVVSGKTMANQRTASFPASGFWLAASRRRLLSPGSCLLAPLPRRRAFSFAEILFAVMILGIGFIMVAAIFPVAIKQTQLTGQETVGATLAVEA